MSVTRRQSILVDVSQFDIEEQRREFERFMQEKADRELAARLHREEDQNLGAPAVNLNNAQNNAVHPATSPGRAARAAPGPVRTERRRPANRSTGISTRVTVTSTARPTARPVNPPSRMPIIIDVSSSSDSSVSSESDSESSTQSSSSGGASSADEDVITTRVLVTQPLLGNDRLMYSRELELAPVDEGQSSSTTHNPPRRVGTPDVTWGDCTMCFETPINPQGCNKCFQPIGCKTCVRNWFNSSQRPSCPLCRSKWTRTPDVSPMATIDRRGQNQMRTHARITAPAPATSTASRVN